MNKSHEKYTKMYNFQTCTYYAEPPEALRTWLGQTLFGLPFSHFIQGKTWVLVIKGLDRSQNLVRTCPHDVNRSQNMARTSPRVLISSGGPDTD